MATKIFFGILTALGVFAVSATLAGIVMEGRYEAFGVATAVGYLFSSIGFLFLVGWTFLKGHLNDVEAPKYKVLSAEHPQDR